MNERPLKLSPRYMSLDKMSSVLERFVIIGLGTDPYKPGIPETGKLWTTIIM